MRDTMPLLDKIEFPPLRRSALEILQVNLGYRCNQQCLHCHVNASPQRKEVMTDSVLDQVIEFLHNNRLRLLDLTGGAPEMHPRFRDLVQQARALDIAVMDRCNLTILDYPGQEDLAEFLAQHEVQITASLPCYLEENVDAQRGAGVFAQSIKALRKLNDLGYGKSGSGMLLNLVYNPQGPQLPPAQQELEEDYKARLREQYAIEFNQLLTLTNMPIKRFGSMLVSKNQFDDYMQLLRGSFQEANLDSVMCRNLLSVDWQGKLYDCDFNQMLDLALTNVDAAPLSLQDINCGNLTGRAIRVAGHCYGCTAGQGSSCSGALS